mmetsp:Transcript_11018/g.37513  ORF Transcript_11018/g.37513 Transcript_11018/m.37513 type:complete len:211 (+) Transcript_11018:63-695(+)
MFKTAAVVLGLAASASAFSAPALRARTARQGPVMADVEEVSAAIPFVKKPKNLNGELLLDIGFDPVGFTNNKSPEQIRILREAEIKHGRVCMLAVTGFIVQELVAPYQKAPFNEPNPINALVTAPWFGIVQIILVAGILENATKNYPNPRLPGDIGFDPLGLSKDGIKEEYAVAELKHGRLAMIAVLAFYVQIAQCGKPVLQHTFEIFSP